MYETVKTVKGYEIKRAKGSRGFYFLTLEEGKYYTKYTTFRTIKAAVEFINTAL